MTFRGKEWDHDGGNIRWLLGTTVRVLCWNSGKNANFAVEAGTTVSHHFYRDIKGKGPEARDAAIELAMSLREEYRR